MGDHSLTPSLQPTSSYIYPVRSLLAGVQPAPELDVTSPTVSPKPNAPLASQSKDAQDYQAQQPPSSKPAHSSPRDGLLRLAHLPPSMATIPFTADDMSAASGMLVVMHDSVDGEIIRSSVHGSRTSASGGDTGSGTGTGSNAGTKSNTSNRQPGAGSAQRSGTSSGPAAGSTSSGALALRSSTGSLSVSSTDHQELLMTTQLQHIQDGDGHHIIVGREGLLVRCEDEPIRAPGAVQGFGVLIALKEDYETGNLVVRQVSENASELLGLTPKYLFSLKCFTQTLPESQANILWDSVQFLNDPELNDVDSVEGSPQVFLLSGWGEPGSGLQDSRYSAQGTFGPALPSGIGGPRREWSCWCAAHRPRQPQKAKDFPPGSEGEVSSFDSDLESSQLDEDIVDTSSPLIILEFELEQDAFNPLYPPYDAAFPAESPGVSSRGSTGGAGSTGGHGVESAGTERINGTGSTDGAGGSSITQHGKSEAENPMPHRAKDLNAPIGVPTGRGQRIGEEEPIPTDVPTSMPAHNHSYVASPRSGGGKGASSGGTVTRAGGGNHGGGSMVYSTKTDPSSGADLSGNELAELSPTELHGLVGDQSWYPSVEDVVESTTSYSRPLRALERMRRITREPGPRQSARKRPSGRAADPPVGGGGGIGTMDVFAVLAQVNNQLESASDLESFLKVVVGVIKDLTQFHRVLVYQFDEQWNGQAVAELVDWSQTHDIFKGLHFPAGDIPAQESSARQLYTINKFRLLYDRSQTTARLVVRDRSDLKTPLDMTHSYLRAMSPIHIKYLANMGVRASMSVSIVTFGQLWGLIACHSYGPHGMRVSFPVRQMLILLSDSISRNIERLSYAQRLHTRKLISTVSTEQHPTGYIVSDAEDLLSLFDADFGVLVIGEGAKILCPDEHGQEMLIVAEYLRLKKFNLMQVSQSVAEDFPDLKLPTELDVITGLLYVPLSTGGMDFIALMRKSQLLEVRWAGKPFKEGTDSQMILEPRTSFKAWKETVSRRSRAWTEEQLETAGVLSLVYGKFIEVWRQKETALKTSQMTHLLLSNASHEVRTPLNHIVNYLEMALNGPLDPETRENLTRSHMASKSLLFTINDLLDLTRHETGHETFFNEPFDLPGTIEDAVTLYRIEAMRRQIQFNVDTNDCPQMVIGDSKKIRTVVSNLTANAVKYTEAGQISVECRRFEEPAGLRDSREVAVEIVVADTGRGISTAKLESIFREFEQVERSMPQSGENQDLGLGLAVVAHIVEQLGGQLRVDSRPMQGSRFSFLIPFALPDVSSSERSSSRVSNNLVIRSRKNSVGSINASASIRSANSRIEDIVEALSAPIGRIRSISSRGGGSQPLSPGIQRRSSSNNPPIARVSTRRAPPPPGGFEGEDFRFSARGAEMDAHKPLIISSQEPVVEKVANPIQKQREQPISVGVGGRGGKRPIENATPLRILVVDDDDTNRKILCKRLTLDGHDAHYATNGQEAVQKIQADREWDCVFMDIQMPILDGFEAAKAIRKIEAATASESPVVNVDRSSLRLNGRIPIFAVSASLRETQREEMHDLGIDGWILKPIGFDRLRVIMKGITDFGQHQRDRYQPGKWELGGWLGEPNPIIGTQH